MGRIGQLCDLNSQKIIQYQIYYYVLQNIRNFMVVLVNRPFDLWKLSRCTLSFWSNTRFKTFVSDLFLYTRNLYNKRFNPIFEYLINF